MFTMNPEVKAKWLAALRSGEYQQTDSCLRDAKGFCCLGVLTDLYIKENPGAEAVWQPITGTGTAGQQEFFQHMDGGDDEEVVMGYTEEAELPRPVMRWAGLNSQDPHIRTDVQESLSLIGMNDGGKTFPEIANVIEARL
jgi:hypothetical protein